MYKTAIISVPEDIDSVSGKTDREDLEEVMNAGQNLTTFIQLNSQAYFIEANHLQLGRIIDWIREESSEPDLYQVYSRGEQQDHYHKDY